MNDYAFFEEQIDKLEVDNQEQFLMLVNQANTILQQHRQLDMLEIILKDKHSTHEQRVEIALELISKLK